MRNGGRRFAVRSSGARRSPPRSPFHLAADGHNRILRGRIDMGAYEYGIGDINEDDAFTLADLRYFWACMYGPDSPANLGECIAFDFHAQPDDRIDLLDFAGVQTTFATGP